MGSRRLTGPQRRAVGVLRGSPSGVTAKGFARAMWPAAEGWLTPSRRGAQARAGRGRHMESAGGSFLARLAERGLAVRDNEGRWTATELALRLVDGSDV